MEEKVLKTPYQLRKEATELAIYNEYNKLIKVPGAMAMAVDSHLMNKYNIGGRSTIRAIRIRVEKRIKNKS